MTNLTVNSVPSGRCRGFSVSSGLGLGGVAVPPKMGQWRRTRTDGQRGRVPRRRSPWVVVLRRHGWQSICLTRDGSETADLVVVVVVESFPTRLAQVYVCALLRSRESECLSPSLVRTYTSFISYPLVTCTAPFKTLLSYRNRSPTAGTAREDEEGNGKKSDEMVQASPGPLLSCSPRQGKVFTPAAAALISALGLLGM